MAAAEKLAAANSGPGLRSGAAVRSMEGREDPSWGFGGRPRRRRPGDGKVCHG